MTSVTLPETTPLALGEQPLYEIVNGRHVEKKMGYYELRLASVLNRYLESFASEHSLGRAVMETHFQLDKESKLVRCPDLAFVSFKRWPENRRMRRAKSWDVIPDLTVEVISPSNTAEEVAIKIQQYFQAGVQQVWVVYPVPQQVYVHSSPAQVNILSRADQLDGSDVLPGFRLPLTVLFKDELEPE